MKRKLVLSSILAMMFLCSFSLFSSRRVAGLFKFSPDKLHYFRVRPHETPDGTIYTLSETSYEQPDALLSDLTLAFNKGEYQISDDSKKYRVAFSSYKHIDDKGASGAGAGYFYKRKHKLELKNSTASWLGSNSDLGSFVLEFRMKPIVLNDGALIFSRVGHNSGVRNGIEITIQNRRIRCSLIDIFTDQKGERHSFEFSSSRALSKKSWHHVALSYNRITGKVELFINGESELLFYATEDSRESGTLYIPSFYKYDMPDIILGTNYVGFLDEFRISYRSFKDLKKVTDIADKRYLDVGANERTPVNREGVITSPIYEFPETGTMIKEFRWRGDVDPQRFIWFEVRLSDDKFDQYHRSPRWFRIENNQRNIYLMKDNDLFLRGKYIQWRAHLIPSPDGKNSPVLQNIEMDYEIDTAPIAPIFPEALERGDGYVTIRWKKNVDHDFLGYNVYYGIKSGHYEGVLRYNKGSLIKNNDQDFIELRIDNSVIEENRSKETSGMLSYPRLKNTVLYFFAITAYDTYRVGTKYNHESKFSNEISIRPFAGSEIRIPENKK